MSNDGISRKSDIPDFADGLHFEWFKPFKMDTPEAMMKFQVAKIAESLIEKALTDDNIRIHAESFFRAIHSKPGDQATFTESIRNLIRKEFMGTMSDTIDTLYSTQKLDTNTILQIIVPIALSILKNALTNGSIIQSLGESIDAHLEKQQPLSPHNIREATYLKDNIQDFILKAHHERKPFSMLAVKFDNLTTKGFSNTEARLLSFIKMVVERESFTPNETIEIVAKEKGYYIILFVNVETKTACLLAWNLDTELKRCFDEKFHLSVSNFDPTIFEKANEEMYKKIEQSRIIPTLYALTLFKILDQGLKISEDEGSIKPKIVIQGRLFFAKEAISLHIDSHIVEQMSYFSQTIYEVLQKHPSLLRQTEAKIQSEIPSETQTVNPKPSSVRTVYFPEDRISSAEEGVLEIRREIPFKGIIAKDEEK